MKSFLQLIKKNTQKVTQKANPTIEITDFKLF